MIFICSEPPCCLVSAQENIRTYWKKLFEKFQEGCLVHDHLLYLSEMKEAFMSLFWPEASNQVFLLMRKYGL